MSVKNCPETPRQRMISLMYLVLTAMLALNVDKSVIDAFALVDQGFMQTIENFNKKNQSVYNKFYNAATNPNSVQLYYTQDGCYINEAYNITSGVVYHSGGCGIDFYAFEKNGAIQFYTTEATLNGCLVTHYHE